MKVLILGGTGDFGQATARLLAASSMVDEIILAGRTRARAEKVAATLGGKGSGVSVDVHQEDRLTEIASSVDVLVSAAGPDFEVPLPAIKAAIRAGVNYADIGADGRMTDQVLALDGEARSAGITSLIGIGAAPGLTNLMAVHAHRQLDAVSELYFGYVWGAWPGAWKDAGATAAAWRASGRVSASWQSVMGFMRGPVRIIRDGQPRDVAPFTHGVPITWPSGQSIVAYPVDTAETRTLPSHLPGVAAITSLVSLWPERLNELWREQSNRMMSDGIAPAEAVIALLEAVAADPERWLADPGPRPDPMVWASARGLSAGRAVRYTCWLRTTWVGVATQQALAAATLALLTGEVRGPGILTPQAAFDPSTLFARVTDYPGIDATQQPLFDEHLEYEV